MRSILFLFMMIVLLTLGTTSYLIWGWKYSGPDAFFEVQEGETFSRVNSHLKQQNFIPSKTLFYRYARYLGVMNKLKAGVFKIKAGANIPAVLKLLVYGSPELISVTVAEGKNMFEIASLLQEKGTLKDKSEFIKLAQDPDFLSKLGLEGNRVEGHLFPDTYKFPPNSPAASIIHQMVEEFHKKTEALNLTQGPLTPKEKIILASIVEKETGVPQERPRIAGVFFNRLEKKMRLQSDPTTIYGMLDRYQGNISKKDLQTKTPYNTYTISGLPPTPICNPGLASILAVISPEEHSYLYFVSKNDGTHFFSSTYEEHAKAVYKFQKRKSKK